MAENRFQGWKDPPLSEVGRRQAELLADRLAESPSHSGLPLPVHPPAAIWHSPLSRAAQTAGAVASRFPGIPTTPSEGLLEIGQGEWEGKRGTDVERSDGELLAAWRRDATTAHAPGGEPLQVAAARVRAGLIDQLAVLRGVREAEPWAILVGHGGSLRLALLSLLGLPYTGYWSFAFATCGITIVELEGGRGSLITHNLTDHLRSLEPRSVPGDTATRDQGVL